jgi:RNA 2',3'-cyclic 3'-phosphodiesterase
MAAVRAFVALPLSAGLKRYLVQVQDRLKGTAAEVRWVESVNMHITLKFFGEVERSRLADADMALRESLSQTPAFQLALNGVGAFPSLRSPRVLWVGISEGRGPLTELHRRLDAALGRQGFPMDARPFQPHLTLGRLTSGRNLEGLAKLLSGECQTKIPAQDMITTVLLVQSVLSPRGPVYTPLQQYQLL